MECGKGQSIDEMPAHTHSESSVKFWCGAYTGGGYAGPPDSTVTGSTGGGKKHNNLPPYYALAFIMKL